MSASASFVVLLPSLTGKIHGAAFGFATKKDAYKWLDRYFATEFIPKHWNDTPVSTWRASEVRDLPEDRFEVDYSDGDLWSALEQPTFSMSREEFFKILVGDGKPGAVWKWVCERLECVEQAEWEANPLGNAESIYQKFTPPQVLPPSALIDGSVEEAPKEHAPYWALGKRFLCEASAEAVALFDPLDDEPSVKKQKTN